MQLAIKSKQNTESTNKQLQIKNKMSSIEEENDVENQPHQRKSTRTRKSRTHPDMLMHSEDETNSNEQIVPRKRKIKQNVPPKKINGDFNQKELFEILQTHFERDGNQIKCCVTDCFSSISRWQLYFMKRHFERCHPTLLSELFPNIMDDTQRNLVEMCEIMYNAVELVTVNGFPFSILDTSAMKGNSLLDLHRVDPY